ncbi:glycoside hydrolase family 97 catalytic domain-containing protein [Kribbella sp. NBC_01245]|uniref:glycoside hydrolase family 97 catalytic domain-containing protein n=1 Tax=Kribbella sp. NBC_01245 TaxID=2903578 RepID=UPI002E29F823|nr:glycoside hydrolase family 97 catalytic domain-containing protein [Kribbella sp. NBC_01245]
MSFVMPENVNIPESPKRRSRRRAAVVAAVVIAGALQGVSSANAAPGSWSTAQPGASSGGCDGVRATIALDAVGKARLSATVNCQDALAPAQLGLTTSTGDYRDGLEFVSRSDATITDNYTTVTGKERVRNRTATLTTFEFRKAGNTFSVILRTSSAGIAFRYQLGTAGTVTDDATEFAVPADTSVTAAPYWPAHEALWSTATIGSLASGLYDYAPLLRRTNGVSVLLAESDPSGAFAGAGLRKFGNGFEVEVQTPSLQVPAGFRTPWRTATIGSPATVFESTLVDDVARPSQIADTSWIKPGISSWSWMDGGHATQRDLNRQKAWVDYAASQGWPYVLVDDGWKDITWMPELTQYAAQRGIGIFLWYHWTDLDTPAERDQQFGRITGWGVKGVKLDFMDSDGQARYQWYDAALADAARYRLMVNFHGARLPQGVSRTWPNLLTQEGIRGGEFLDGSRTIGHVAAAPFGRGAVGGADYTPMGFQHAQPNSGAVELALGVLYDSGLLLPAGSRSSYAARPAAQWWLRQLPTVWDETRLLAGTPTTGAVVARRNNGRWYVGAMRVGGPTSIGYSTAFLGSGTWQAEIVNDTAGGGFSRTSQTIQAGQALTVPTTVTNGGHVVRFTKAATLPVEPSRVLVESTGQSVNVAFAEQTNGAAVMQWPANDDPNSRFRFESVGDGHVRMIAQHSSKAVVTLNASTSAGAPIIQYSWESGPTQNDEWLAEDAGGGRFRLLNRGSGLYLTMPSTTAGAQFTQSPFDASPRQLFRIG